MTASLLLALLWAVAANLHAGLPDRHGRSPAAYALLATGVPLLGYVTLQNGGAVGLAVLALGALLLRWPLWRVLPSLLRRSSLSRSVERT